MTQVKHMCHSWRMISCVRKQALQINQVDDSPVWGKEKEVCWDTAKTLVFWCSHPFPGKFNHSNQKSIPVSDDSLRLNQNNKWNTLYSRRATNFSPALGESWALAKSQSLHSHTRKQFQIPSTEEKKKILKKGKIPNSKGSRTQREE